MFRQSHPHLGLFQFEELNAFPRFVHAFTSRVTDETLKQKDTTGASEVAKRRHIFECLGVPVERVVLLQQVHSNRIVEQKHYSRDDAGDLKAGLADGILLLEPGYFGVVRTADCLPVVAVVPKKDMACLLHAGWRGTRDHIVRCGVRRLMEVSASRPEDIVVGFGPAIRRCCYEVGDELREQFHETGHNPEGLFGNGRLDLVEASRRELKELGVVSVLDSGLCTCCSVEDFYSLRGRGDSGRMWAIAGFRQIERRQTGSS